jgi:uncharacterized sulfatase
MDSPNILWITLDSLRSDHTTIDGYGRDTTPEMARFGDDGHAFANCFAHAKSTLPSTGAILTGLAPSRNTLGVAGDVLPDGITTIPERFADAGYTTACLSRNSFLSAETGLDRGFDRFQWLASETIRDAGLKTLLKYALNIRSHSAGLARDTAKHSSPFLMNEVAKGWLDDFESSADPFFFYLHYNEPHRPYYPPLGWIDEYADETDMPSREAAEFALDVHYNLDEIVANGCELSDREWEALLAMYDAEIAYTDEMVGRLVDYVQSLDIGDTVIVITGDHGELFGEYGLLSHSYVLIDAVTRVPLVLQGFENELAVSDDDIIQHSDVMTTLLRMAGADAAETVGVDLRENRREFAVSQRGPQTFDSLRSYNPDFDDSRFHQEMLTSIRTGQYRFDHSEDWEALYELPNEETDVSPDKPDVVADLSSDLDEWMATHGSPVEDAETTEYSEAAERQLRDLGYME